LRLFIVNDKKTKKAEGHVFKSRHGHVFILYSNLKMILTTQIQEKYLVL